MTNNKLNPLGGPDPRACLLTKEGTTLRCETHQKEWALGEFPPVTCALNRWIMYATRSEAAEAVGAFVQVNENHITINGVAHITPRILDYWMVLDLYQATKAHIPNVRGKGVVWSIAFHNSADLPPDGILARDHSVAVMDGTRFDVADTSRA